MKLSVAFLTLFSGSLVPSSKAFSGYTNVSPALRSYTSRVAIASQNLVALNSATIDQTQTEHSTISENAEETAAPTYLDDGFIFGLEGSGLNRPRGKVSQVVVEGDSLETTPFQVGLVSTTLLSHFSFAMYSIGGILAMNGGDIVLTTVQSILVILSSWILADFGSGVLHWSVDNYGNGRTPVMGSIIAAFQGHHSAPWTITERGFFNNVYKLCIPFGIPTVAIITLLAGPNNPMTALFFAVFCTMEIMSQEFHKWSHMTKGQTSGLINKLQDWGMTIGRKPHALHHTEPFEGKYCIVSGICNPFLDESGFFRRLEKIVYDINGVESNAWKLDSKLREKTLRGDYSS